jgi:pimeloyl-ACP methyl ester carboxylesterase
VNTGSLNNYGPDASLWELWHRGPIHDGENVVLVHGYRLPLSGRRGRCDQQFADLDDLLQNGDNRFNVWQFECAGRRWGTPRAVATYASRLGEAVARICEITGNHTCSIVAYSMGGIIAREYIRSGGKSVVDKLLTLATPHLGTLRLQPFSLKWPRRFFPRAASELRPDSSLLWDLNTRVDDSLAPEFAAIGGYSWGRSDGLVETGSTSLIRTNSDGSVAESLYFAGVDRSHLSISQITDEDDEVYQMVRSFLLEGVAGISSVRPPERPGDYNVHPLLTFALRERPRWRMLYPSVVVTNTGRRYRGLRVMSQGARTEDGSHIFTVPLKPDDDGEARVFYARGKYATVMIQRGQSTVVREPIGPDVTPSQAVSLAAA